MLRIWEGEDLEKTRRAGKEAKVRETEPFSLHIHMSRGVAKRGRRPRTSGQLHQKL